MYVFFLSRFPVVSCAFAASNFNDFGHMNYETERKKTHVIRVNRTKTAAAASSFEPDFTIPLENVTVAQGRDGLYLNKSNKTQYFVHSELHREKTKKSCVWNTTATENRKAM